MSSFVKRIRLVVTGDLEHKALTGSMAARFPVADGGGVSVCWLRPQKSAATTTHRLDATRPPTGPMRALAKKLVSEAWVGEDGKPPDLVIAIDDLEVHNFNQPAVVCDAFRQAVEYDLNRRQLSQATEARLRQRLRDRCSFHLLCPMIETYFFGEADALKRAGCAPGIQPGLANLDLEDFVCNDPAWLPHCQEENSRKAGSTPPMPWWREERHPKHYLEHLVGRNHGLYQELLGGKEALKTLDWHGVPANASSIALLRALFADIADFFGIPSPLGSGQPSPLTYPPLAANHAGLLLRNL